MTDKHETPSIRLDMETIDVVLEASFDSVFLTDKKGQIVRANTIAVETFGYEEEKELVGLNISAVIGGPHAANHASYLETVTQESLQHVLGRMRDVLAKRKDGSEFHVQVGIKMFQGGFLAFCHDLTRHRKQLREVTEKERLNQAILEASFDPVFLTDKKGQILRANNIAVETFGYADEKELVGLNISAVIGGPHAANHASYLETVTQESLQHVLGRMRDVLAKRKDGSEFHVQVGIKMFQGGFLAFCHDLTRHLKQLHEVMEKERLNQAILDSSFDAVVLSDKIGTILDVNEATVSIFGFKKKEQIIGCNIKQFVGGGHAKNHDSYMKAFHERGGTSRILGRTRELSARRHDGSEFPCQIGVKKVPGKAELMVGYIRDVTAEKEAASLAAEKRAAEELLHNMLPPEVATRLKDNPGYIADHFTHATTLFADIVGFTSMSNQMKPIEVVQFLNDIFSRFDKCLEEYGLNKIKTIGDCYMVTSIPGMAVSDESSSRCSAVCHFALDMIDALEDYNKDSAHPLSMRIGINIGPVVAGVVGTKRFLYDIWGDAVNIASRMESSGVPGRVQVTQGVLEHVEPDQFEFEKRGIVSVKGIGDMETYFLNGRKAIDERDRFRLSEREKATHQEDRLLEVLSSSYRQLAGSTRILNPNSEP